MKYQIFFLLVIIFTFLKPLCASPILPMNRAFTALSELMPFMTDREKFMEKKHAPKINEKMEVMQKVFKSARHETVLKEDLFAPSYVLINESLSQSIEAFKQGKKDYAHWRLIEITNHCLDCHTRLPPSYSSSFQNGELTINKKNYEDVYNLGLAQLIVRRYTDAKTSFIQAIDDKFIKHEFNDIEIPMKQLLYIDAKVMKNPQNLIATFENYEKRKELPTHIKSTLNGWLKRLKHWKNNSILSEGFQSDKEIEKFIAGELAPLKKSFLTEENEVDLLFASGLLSNYFFLHPKSPLAPEINYWLGWTEKYLKREHFFGSGDLFLKQCIKRYPTHPVAKKCLEEFQESVNFEFTGSGGTNIPEEVQNEIKELGKLIKVK